MWTRLLRELPTLDEISITMQLKGDESWGVLITRVDVASGSSGTSTSPNTDKGKGKAAMPVCSNDKVSSDDDHPL
jgi:hypothetical protein